MPHSVQPSKKQDLAWKSRLVIPEDWAEKSERRLLWVLCASRKLIQNEGEKLTVMQAGGWQKGKAGMCPKTCFFLPLEETLRARLAQPMTWAVLRVTVRSGVISVGLTSY